MTTRLLLVGCGKMGGALLKGWSTYPSLTMSVLEPHDTQADYQNVTDIPPALIFDVIVLAVKPQVLLDVVTSIKHLATPTTVFLSIAAGKPISFFENMLGTAQPIIRTMPNTPALVGQGISVLCGNTASHPYRQTALDVMKAVGQAEWIDDETMMDAVTALSGSGPAYVFHLIEAMTAAGIIAGLPAALATSLARQTVIGAAALAAHDKDTPASTLRQNVTSPSGTTEAALNVLMSENNGLTDLMTRAILAAKKRSEELAI